MGLGNINFRYSFFAKDDIMKNEILIVLGIWGCSFIGVFYMAKRGLYANINARKKKGISRSKKNSTISPKAYANMKAGFPKKKKKKKA